MKNLCLVTLVTCFFNPAFSQKINQPDLRLLRKSEDSLKKFSTQIIEGINAADRLSADSNFTRMFVRSLKTKNSFYFPFDSLVTISKLIPPDSSFKIFTWQLNINDDVVRQHGAIQMRTRDGSLDLLPLIDKSDVVTDAADTIGDNYGWIGALYYQIIEKQGPDKKYYTLLGYDENSIRSNKKIVEVLTFNNGRPVFGGPYFAGGQQFGNRFIMEYKKDAGTRLTYDQDLDMIVYEHLFSETGEPQKKYTYIPDGDYEGLKWRNGKWMYVEKVFPQQLKDGQAPLPNPIRDERGNLNEALLKDIVPDDKNASTEVRNGNAPATKTSNKKTKTKGK